MQIIQVRQGADRAQLNETARHCGLKVGIQGGMQIVYIDSSRMSTNPNKQRLGDKPHCVSAHT